MNHAEAMRLACNEALRYLGATSPNPPVGAAALDENGVVLAVAAHQQAGTPHAEAALLGLCRQQGILNRLHTLCVTLEPCNHHGRTPPCTEAILAADIRHVVVGTRDPNPHVTGHGIEWLRQSGLDVTVGVEEERCRQLIYAFGYSVTQGRPWVTVKRALDPQGSMIPPAGQKTFTSPESLRLAHRLRKRSDVILTGSGTILADIPAFTVRHVQDHPGKRRWLAILDRRCRVPKSYLEKSVARGFEPVLYQDLQEVLRDLGQRGAREILVEAGPQLSQAVLDSDLWAMDIVLHQGAPDWVDVRFNSQMAFSFNKAAWHWDNLLPYEGETHVCHA